MPGEPRCTELLLAVAIYLFTRKSRQGKKHQHDGLQKVFNVHPKIVQLFSAYSALVYFVRMFARFTVILSYHH